jgi:hypothetical protein
MRRNPHQAFEIEGEGMSDHHEMSMDYLKDQADEAMSAEDNQAECEASVQQMQCELGIVRNELPATIRETAACIEALERSSPDDQFTRGVIHGLKTVLAGMHTRLEVRPK